MGSIEGQDLVLRAAKLQPGRLDGFDHLLPERALPTAREADYLHGDSAAAADHMAGFYVAYEGPDEGNRVDAGVMAKMPVLEFDDCARAAVWDRIGWRETPLLIVCDTGSEELTAAIGNYCSVGRAFEEVLRQAEEPACQKDR